MNNQPDETTTQCEMCLKAKNYGHFERAHQIPVAEKNSNIVIKTPPKPETPQVQPQEAPVTPPADCCCHRMVQEAPAQVQGQNAAPQNLPVNEDVKPITSPNLGIPGNFECYLPQPEDKLPVLEKPGSGEGKADWGHLALRTGTRPTVDKYSIYKYGESEWRAKNKEILEMVANENHRCNLIDWNSSQAVETSLLHVNGSQYTNTRRINQRHMEIYKWKCELKRAIDALVDEICMLEKQRQRIKRATHCLEMPESIARECIEVRTSRSRPELVRDDVEVELLREVDLIAEVRDAFTRVLKDVEKQLVDIKTVKSRIEHDWSNKSVAYAIETYNEVLPDNLNTITFNEGSVACQEEQSAADFWLYATRENLQLSEAARQRSVTLRNTTDSMISDYSHDLRTQADKVEVALSQKITCVHELTNKLDTELKITLSRLADVEKQISAIRSAIRVADYPLKVAQTRLQSRTGRPGIENCRDPTQFALMEEVKTIGEYVAALQSQLNQNFDAQTELIKVRCTIEKEIMNQKKTLDIDRIRVSKIRSFYPSITVWSGYN